MITDGTHWYVLDGGEEALLRYDSVDAVRADSHAESIPSQHLGATRLAHHDGTVYGARHAGDHRGRAGRSHGQRQLHRRAALREHEQ